MLFNYKKSRLISQKQYITKPQIQGHPKVRASYFQEGSIKEPKSRRKLDATNATTLWRCGIFDDLLIIC
jgi:hypothetical protein